MAEKDLSGIGGEELTGAAGKIAAAKEANRTAAKKETPAPQQDNSVKDTLAAFSAMPKAKKLGRKFIIGSEYTLGEVKEFILGQLAYNGKATVDLINPNAIIQALVNKYNDVSLAKAVHDKLTVDGKIPFIAKIQLPAVDFMTTPSAGQNPMAIIKTVKVVNEKLLEQVVGKISPTINGAFVYPYVYSDDKIDVFVDMTKILCQLLQTDSDGDIVIGKGPDQFSPKVNVVQGSNESNTIIALSVLKNRVRFQA